MALLLFSTDLYAPEILDATPSTDIILIEDSLFFNRNSEALGNMQFNILKPIYHRATMKYYSTQIACTYIELEEDWVSIVREKYNNKTVSFFNPTNRYLLSKIKTLGCKLKMLDTPRFILREDELSLYKGPQIQTSFYRWMRDKYDILLDKLGNPYGGKLTYDSDNRNGPYKSMENDLPKEYESLGYEAQYIIEATDYVMKTIPHTDFIRWKSVELKFPISRSGALCVLKQFINEKIANFGTYQDAIVGSQSFMFHASISPMLNIGLLTPVEVINSVVSYFSKLAPRTRKVQIHNVEGFIRQVIGWREYCRYFYSKNEQFVDTFGLKSKLSPKWYSGFGVDPVDLCIHKAFKYGYLHHTERLMICANFMLYLDTDSREMYKWFMEFALDSYDWVMEFNVFKMACYSSKPVVSKPYICGSHYLLKMSDIPRGVWCKKWDYMFWFFIDKHKEEIQKIYRLVPLVKFAKAKLEDLKVKYLFESQLDI